MDFVRNIVLFAENKQKKMASLFFFYSLVCFVFLSHFSSSSVHHLCSFSEASALLQFKKPFGISLEKSDWCDNSSFPKTSSWNESRDCCSWDGVKCDMLTGHVIGLDLSCSKLSGTIHPNSSLFQIHLLRSLNLAYNNFSSSSIPSGIGRLRNLKHLNLSGSLFDGKIPIEISHLSNLVSLDLSSLGGCELDQKTFETLLQNFTNLKVVSLSGVNISSPIPMNLSSSLRYVNLGYTNLQGVLTESFFLLPNLERLNLGYNNFTGQIPNSIGNLTQIRELYLGRNHFTGQIPNSIGNLTQIRELDLGVNHFTGQILNSIGNLTQIRELDLGDNDFTGQIPNSIGNLTQIRGLYLGSNNFTGQIPNFIGNLTQIRELDLCWNHFTGQIPSAISNLKQLTDLDLSYNSLGGEIPNVFSNLQELVELDLSHNSLNGTIPSWVFSLPSLWILSLHHNQFSRVADELKANPALKILYLSHNQLSGPFLQSLENLTNLSFLDLSSNNMDARINITFPSLEVLFLSSCELKAFPHLRNSTALMWLDLSNNKIDGPISNWFSGMRWDSLEYLNLSHSSLTGHIEQLHYPNLRHLDLKFNSLQGQLPSSICKLKSLQLLDLSHNHFSGYIPMELGQLNMLEALDLSWNRLIGNIPQGLTRLTFLANLNLSQNLLVGHIPQGSQFNTFSMDSYGGNLDLCGPPLSKQCGTSDSSHVPPPLECKEEEESYFLSGFTWESVVIGYSCGLLVGTVMWSLMFKARKPKWVVEFLEGAFPKKMRRAKKRNHRRRT